MKNKKKKKKKNRASECVILGLYLGFYLGKLFWYFWSCIIDCEIVKTNPWM